MTSRKLARIAIKKGVAQKITELSQGIQVGQKVVWVKVKKPV